MATPCSCLPSAVDINRCICELSCRQTDIQTNRHTDKQTQVTCSASIWRQTGNKEQQHDSWNNNTELFQYLHRQSVRNIPNIPSALQMILSAAVYSHQINQHQTVALQSAIQQNQITQYNSHHHEQEVVRWTFFSDLNLRSICLPTKLGQNSQIYSCIRYWPSQWLDGNSKQTIHSVSQ